jgi:hypothetical protein
MDYVSAPYYTTIAGRRTFQDVNPGAGVLNGTTWGAVWAGGVNDSIVQTILGAGMAPADFAPAAVDTQLRDAVKILAAKSALPGGQCRLSVASSTSLLLSPHNGNLIWVNGGAVAIPSAGASIANTGLVAATLYYVYAWLNAGVLTLELSATGHVTSTADGTEVKTGDATRALVGMVYTGAGAPGIFQVQTGILLACINWFNRRSIPLTGTSFSGALTSSTSFTAINTGSCQFSVLNWADESLSIQGAGSVSNSSVATMAGAIALDTTVIGAYASVDLSTGGQPSAIAASACATPSEGLHTVTAYGYTTAGTASFAFNMVGVVRG